MENYEYQIRHFSYNSGVYKTFVESSFLPKDGWRIVTMFESHDENRNLIVRVLLERSIAPTYRE